MRRARRLPNLRGVPKRPLALVLLLALSLLVPQVRAVAGSAWRAVQEAVEEGRRAEARRARIQEYAARYGIGFELAEAIYAAAEAEKVDPELAFRLVRVESAFRERAVSRAGALGLTQLMPATAAELRPGITRAEVLERETNLRLGFRYLRLLLRVYDGDVAEALHAYNRGMGTVARIRSSGGDPANGYAELVLGERGSSPVGAPAGP